MVRMMIQLTEEQVRALKALAKTRKVPVAKLVRESVAAYVNTAAKDPERLKRKRRALAGLEKNQEGKVPRHRRQERPGSQSRYMSRGNLLVMIYVDTSALLALVNEADLHYEQAMQTWRQVIEEEQHLVCNNYVLAESIALIKRNRRQISLVGIASFDTMRRHHIETAFTFDEHFRKQGFKVIP